MRAKRRAKRRINPHCRELPSPTVEPNKPRLLAILGPGVIASASDDDPSGIATLFTSGGAIRLFDYVGGTPVGNSKDATMPEEQRFIAAEQTIRPWLAQTSDPPDRQPKLWELDDEIAAEEVDDFSAGLLAHIEKELNTLAVARDKP